MRSPREEAFFLRDLAANRLPRAVLGVCEVMARDVEYTVKHLIGQELPEWQALAPATVKIKQAGGFTGQVSATDPLLRTGEMRESVRSGFSREGAGAGAMFWVGSDSEVARDQEVGTAKIPPRPFMALGMLKSEWKVEAELAEMTAELFAR